MFGYKKCVTTASMYIYIHLLVAPEDGVTLAYVTTKNYFYRGIMCGFLQILDMTKYTGKGTL